MRHLVRPKRMRWKPATTSAVVACLLTLGGCSWVPLGVPTSGPVEVGAQMGAKAPDQLIRVIGRPPEPGMTPKDIVAGFLEAATSFDNDHAVAREYLTESASASWDPSSMVSVYEGSLDIQPVTDGVLEVSGTKVASIDRIGTLSVSGGQAEVNGFFGLQRVAGQWRIAGVPQGLILSRFDLDRSFRTYNVYFFDPTFHTFVADPRTLPTLGTGLATSLVRALVAGPSGWLSPAVSTAFPSDTELQIDAVPVSGGVARVVLPEELQSMDDQARRVLSAQIGWTLRQVPEVSSVDIQAGPQPLLVPGVSSPQVVDQWSSYDTDIMPLATSAYLETSEGLSTLGAGGVQPVPGPAGRGEPFLGPLVISHNGTEAAGIDPTGNVYRLGLTESSYARRIITQRGVVDVELDSAGGLWLVDNAGNVLIMPSSGDLQAVGLQGVPSGSQIVGIRIARDGVRAAVRLRDAESTYVVLMRIEGLGTDKLSLAAPRRVDVRLTNTFAIAWSGDDTLIVLAQEGTPAKSVYEIDLAKGTMRSLQAPDHTSAIAAAPGFPILAGASNGTIYELSGSVWRERTDGHWPVYPG